MSFQILMSKPEENDITEIKANLKQNQVEVSNKGTIELLNKINLMGLWY